jgi:hypothetical protein
MSAVILTLRLIDLGFEMRMSVKYSDSLGMASYPSLEVFGATARTSVAGMRMVFYPSALPGTGVTIGVTGKADAEGVGIVVAGTTDGSMT